MEAAGIGLAIAGLGSQLNSVGVEGYKLLSSTAQPLGRDHQVLALMLDAEKRYLEKWAEAWIHSQTGKTIDPSHQEYRLAMTTLAQISALFAQLIEYSSRYGINCDSSPRKRDVLRSLIPMPFRRLFLSPQRHPERLLPNQSGLDRSSMKLLIKPCLLSLDQIKPNLANEVNLLMKSADILLKTLPAKRKLRWSVVDRDKFEHLIVQLKDHNETLNKSLPLDSNSQCLCGDLHSISSSFAVPLQLPFSRNNQFCGREDIINTLHSSLGGSAPFEYRDEKRPLAPKVVVLHGIGGIGKSSIALEYSFRYSKSYTAVFWVDVTNTTSLSLTARKIAEHLVAHYAGRGLSYERIASTLGLKGLLDLKGQIATDEASELRITGAVKEWLAAEKNEGWLLILDNYDDVDAVDLHHIMPGCSHGNVIITSRKSSLEVLGKTVAVNTINEQSGIMLLLKCANKAEVTADENYNMARQVASELGFMPFALTQAGSYISRMKTPFQKYLASLDEKFRTVGMPEMSLDPDTTNMNRTLFSTLEISFASLSRSAQEILLLCGFLAPDDIPDIFFVKEGKPPFAWVPQGDKWLTDSLGELFSFSLATRKASGDAFRVHPVVHVWARERLDIPSKTRKEEEAVILCGRLHPQHRATTPSQSAFERRVWSHIDYVQRSLKTLPRLSNLLGLGEVLFNAASNMGQIYANHGLPSQAIYLFEWAQAGQDHFLGEGHSLTLSTTDSIAITFYKQAEYGKAIEWYRRAYDVREKTLGKDHKCTLRTLDNVVATFSQQECYDNAMEWNRCALNSREKTLGSDHAETLKTVHNMARLFHNQRQYENALEWYRRVLEGYEKTLGNDHPDTLRVVHNMALIFYEQAQYEKALEWYQRALNRNEEIRGKDHPDTLATAQNIALLYNKQGQYAMAREWCGRALTGREKTLGKDHPDTLRSVHHMARLFHKQGQQETALEWYERALDGREKTLGKDNLDTLRTVNSMAVVFYKQEDYNKALEWYGRAFSGREKTLGIDKPSTLLTVHNMALVFYKEGKYEKAQEWFGRALHDQEKILGKNHLDTLLTVHNMALVFNKQRLYGKALEWCERALNGREKALGKDHPDTLYTVNNMGLVFYDKRQYSKALVWYERALHGQEKIFEKDHLHTLITVQNIAWVFYDQGQYETAREWFGRALNGREKTLGNDHRDTLDTVQGMARTFDKQGQHQKALEWYERALHGKVKTLRKNHPSILRTIKYIDIAKNHLSTRRH